MCVYQPEKTGNLWVHDSSGSWQLDVRSADLRVIEWAFNQALKQGYKASEFKVLAQEPAKAKPVNQLTKRTRPHRGKRRFNSLLHFCGSRSRNGAYKEVKAAKIFEWLISGPRIQ
jgi:hypothetical protein